MCVILFQPQYEFVYTALLEFVTCGDTSITGAETLKQKITELSAINHSVNKTGFQLQFEVNMIIFYLFLISLLIRN